MEQHRFDDLTRAAAHRESRRGFLRGLIGAAAASLGLGAFGQDTAAQDCPPGTAMCDGACVDVMSDKMNCGSCGNPCKSGECIEGGCTPFVG